MKILFLGDIAIPDKESLDCLNIFLEDNAELFSNAITIANIEGVVSEDGQYLHHKNPVLFNLPSAITLLKQKANLTCASLANNHTLDLPLHIDETMDCMRANDVITSGIQYNNLNGESTKFNVKSHDIIIFNACWKQLLNHQKNPAPNGLKVIEIDEKKMLSQIKTSRTTHPKATHVVYLHWNFDLEILPFPAHRHFAKALIDNGADIVVGCHAHCIQPFELYKGKGIFYNIGNFLIPSYKFANKRLFFPKWANVEHIVEYDMVNHSSSVHVIEYSSENSLHKLEKTETIKVDETYIAKHFHFLQNNYDNYFKINRRKKKFVPIYSHYSDKRNLVFDAFLKIRGLTARYITTLGLRNWQN